MMPVSKNRNRTKATPNPEKIKKHSHEVHQKAENSNRQTFTERVRSIPIVSQSQTVPMYASSRHTQRIDKHRPQQAQRNNVQADNNQYLNERTRESAYPVKNSESEKKVQTQNLLRKSSRRKNAPMIAISDQRVIKAKRKSTIESPTRIMNKKLMQLVANLRKRCDQYRNELKKSKGSNLGELIELQKENEGLNLEVYKMEGKLEEWKERCRKQENRDLSLAKVKTLTKEIKHLKEDEIVYKTVICRLNNELGVYQNRLGIVDGNFTEKVISYDVSNSDSNTPGSTKFNDALEQPQKNLLPLLLAYDEVIKEKNEIVKDHEQVLERFKIQCKDIIKENEDLHSIIKEKKDQGTVSIEEWQFLHTNSLIVLEENDLLHEKIQLLQKKNEAIINSQNEKVSKLIMEHQAKLSEIIEKRMPVEQHEASVLECKTLFQELKISYDSERTIIIEKLQSAEKERDRLADELAELEAKNGRLQSNLTTCEETLAVNAAQFREVYNRMIEATKARDETVCAMQEMMELSQRVVLERENMEKLVNEQRSLNERLILVRERECELVAELQEKIKDMENVHMREIQKLLGKIKDLESLTDGIGADNQDKCIRLENLVEEKSKRIDHLETEKRQLQADLETVWKTTTLTMRDIRGTNKNRSTQSLRDVKFQS